MFPIHPPTGPFLLNTTILGFPLQVRWYGVLIVSGALIAGWFAARRAERRGIDPEHVWNQLMLGMIMGILGARLYYVAFEWRQFANRSWLDIINPSSGGLAIHGALIGAILSGVIYTRWNKLPFWQWLDICMPTFLIAQALGRWGNFFNQEAYGRPTTLPFGVSIDDNRRLPPYDDMVTYPPNTLFHATFLYESIWNLSGFGLLLWLERRYKHWLRTGDMVLMYAIWYGIGRFWIEGLRTDSLCTSGIGGGCEGALRAAQIVSLLLVAIGVIGMIYNHRRPLTAAEQGETVAVAADADDDAPAEAAAPVAPTMPAPDTTGEGEPLKSSS